ncbi:hypothetical protein NDI85_11910 [Halomicroarcula sp. S1AR25-4]|uniref:hypothetical protein n=1 Tax=Haloarcula sp. S1AR25-4 TaxID=2950538 RepID=UPI002876DC3B|nr:hypothetical protein [Halomicroarcula sp. S1AR25-4]MDS0278503.1 hypothetical protein [Halomicroarcula sp. S1AR25-4]
MERDTKVAAILSLLAGVVLLWGSRLESLALLAVGTVAFLAAAVRFRSPIATYVAAGVLPLVFQVDNWGWLSGRDAHGEAVITKNVLEHGWPIPPAVHDAWGFQATPGLHFLTAVLARVTGLPVVPGVEGRVLVTQLLPVVFVWTTLALVVVAARTVTARPSTALVPLLCWTPLLYFYTSFRRPSMGLVLVTFVVSTLFLSRRPSSTRMQLLTGLGLLVLAFTHHLTTLYAMLFLGSYAAVTWSLSQFTEADSATPLRYVAGALGSGGVLVAVLAQFESGRRFLGKIVGLVVPASGAPDSNPNQSGSPSPDGSTGAVSDGGPVAKFLDNAAYHTQNFLVPWGYAGVLGSLSVFALGTTLRRDESVSPFLLTSVAFGGLAAALGLLGWLAGMLEFRRPLTVWVVVCGWLGVVAVLRNRPAETGLRRVVFACLLVFGVLMVPAYDLGVGTPNYATGEAEQEFSPQLYATAEFVDEYGTRGRVVGDANVREVVSPLGQTLVETRPETIKSGVNATGTYVVLEYPRNDRLYFGPTPSGWVHFDPADTNGTFRNESVIYTTDSAVVYT